MKHSLWILVSVAAALAALVWRRLEAEPSAPAARASSGVAASELVSVPTTRPKRPPARSVATAATPNVAAPAPAPQDPPVEPARISDDLESYRDYLDMTFEQDTRDRSWEASAEPRLRSGLARLETDGVRVASLECRASLCRAIVVTPDAGKLESTKAALLEAFPWEGPGVVTDAPPSGPADFRIALFFGREGRELPDS